jgi:hypothetical protein
MDRAKRASLALAATRHLTPLAEDPAQGTGAYVTIERMPPGYQIIGMFNDADSRVIVRRQDAEAFVLCESSKDARRFAWLAYNYVAGATTGLPLIGPQPECPVYYMPLGTKIEATEQGVLVKSLFVPQTFATVGEAADAVWAVDRDRISRGCP